MSRPRPRFSLELVAFAAFLFLFFFFFYFLLTFHYEILQGPPEASGRIAVELARAGLAEENFANYNTGEEKGESGPVPVQLPGCEPRKLLRRGVALRHSAMRRVRWWIKEEKKKKGRKKKEKYPSADSADSRFSGPVGYHCHDVLLTFHCEARNDDAPLGDTALDASSNSPAGVPTEFVESTSDKRMHNSDTTVARTNIYLLNCRFHTRSIITRRPVIEPGIIMPLGAPLN